MRRPRPVRLRSSNAARMSTMRAERAGREVGGLHGGYPGSGVGERARPAHVVEVVACAPGMTAFVAETGDRADDGGLGNPEPQPLEHPGPEAVEDDVGARRRAPGRPGSSTHGPTSTISLPAFTASYHAGAPCCIGSPSGGSTLTTRAPSRISSRLAYGPGNWRVKSTTRWPASGCMRARTYHYASRVD